MTAPDADVVVVGSGPAGVSAAWPLAEAGLRVLLLDASEPGAGPGLAPARHRADPDHWKTRFGADLAAVEAPPDVSPKFGTPRARAARAGFPDRIGLSTAGFFAAGSLGRGGLSTIWGRSRRRSPPPSAPTCRFPPPSSTPPTRASPAESGWARPPRPRARRPGSSWRGTPPGPGGPVSGWNRPRTPCWTRPSTAGRPATYAGCASTAATAAASTPAIWNCRP
ncbi:FAD-dependent oxidoreductase [Methylobacterium tardum]|uniref:FAD-dependent oxidoreductase n=1 Tax=Methylobacterium tardum TaxID=374432 RepID=UPI0036210877